MRSCENLDHGFKKNIYFYFLFERYLRVILSFCMRQKILNFNVSAKIQRECGFAKLFLKSFIFYGRIYDRILAKDLGWN